VESIQIEKEVEAMPAIAAWLGLLLCRLFVNLSMRTFAPAVCFGGDTTTVGFYALTLVAAAAALLCSFSYRVSQDSTVIMIILALTFIAAGSAALIEFID
jgi:hypothetical protein